MFNSMPQVAKKAMTLAANGRKFITGEPNKLYYGTLSLKQYLEENGERDAFIIRDLNSLDQIRDEVKTNSRVKSQSEKPKRKAKAKSQSPPTKSARAYRLGQI